MGRWGRVIAALLFALLVSAPDIAPADSQTFNAVFFKPAIGRNAYLMLEGTQTLHQLQFDVGEIFSYGYHPLQIVQGGTRSAGVIDHLLVSDFVASFGATEYLQIGLDMPVVLINKFSDPQQTPQPAMKNYMNMGDLRVDLKARVLDSCKGFIGLAFVPFMTAPTGSSAHYVGDPGLTGGLKIALDGRVHPSLGLTLNVGFQTGKKTSIRNITFQNQLLLGGGVAGYFGHGIGVTAEVNAKADFSRFFKDRDMNPAEVMVAANVDVKETGVTIYGGGGTCLTCGVSGAKARGVVGVKYRFNPEKFRELDRQAGAMCAGQFGKLSYEDLLRLRTVCPADPAQFEAGVHDAACPKYYDLREVAGLVLRCPPSAEQFRPGIDDPGCPKVFDLASAFSPDEVMNIYTLATMEMSMLCPPDAAQFNPQIHDLACPKYFELRAQLPEELRMAIFELAAQAGIVGGEIQTLRPIYFDFNSSVIRPDMMTGLDQVLATINANTWIKEVKIGGHADARGTAAANDLIAQKRAAAVIGYLTSHGARPGVSYRPVSYGAWRPAASNDTEEGRALNRRVVFMIGEREYDMGAVAVPMPRTPAGAAAAMPAAVPAAPAPTAPSALPFPAVEQEQAPAPAPAADDEAEEKRPPRPPSRWH